MFEVTVCVATSTTDTAFPVSPVTNIVAAIGREGDRAWTLGRRDTRDDGARRRVDGHHGVVRFAGDVDDAAVGPQRSRLRAPRPPARARRWCPSPGRAPTSPPSPRWRRRASCRRATDRTTRDPVRWDRCGPASCVARSTTPMPSAARSGGGSVDSSTPGGAIGEPDSATNSWRPSRDSFRPRGRLPTATACSTAPVAGSTIATVPAVSFETNTRTAAGAAVVRFGHAAAGARRTAPPGPPATTCRRTDDFIRATSLLVEREGVQRVARRDEDVLPAVEHVGDRRVA